jgi:hypothetical protein
LNRHLSILLRLSGKNLSIFRHDFFTLVRMKEKFNQSLGFAGFIGAAQAAAPFNFTLRRKTFSPQVA